LQLFAQRPVAVGELDPTGEELLRQLADFGAACETRLLRVGDFVAQLRVVAVKPEGFVTLSAADELGFTEHLRLH
jgi:hypothetical protein